jgi:hypothetical protein
MIINDQTPDGHPLDLNETPYPGFKALPGVGWLT